MVKLKDGTNKTIIFEGIEENLPYKKYTQLPVYIIRKIGILNYKRYHGEI